MANEKRLIDANLLEVVFGNAKKSCRTDLMRSIYSVVLKAVNEAPTVDAVEVVHGKWTIIVDDYDCEFMCCSVCGEMFYDGDNDTVDCLHNYCPNCGAKMDGDGNA